MGTYPIIPIFQRKNIQVVLPIHAYAFLQNFDIYKLEDEDETHSYVIYSVTRDGKTGNLDKWSFDDKGPQHHWGVLNRSMHLISLDEVLCEAQLSDRTLKFVNRDELVRCSKVINRGF